MIFLVTDEMSFRLLKNRKVIESKLNSKFFYCLRNNSDARAFTSKTVFLEIRPWLVFTKYRYD